MESVLALIAEFAGTQLISMGADAVTDSVLDSMGIHTSDGMMYKEVTDVVTDFGAFAAHDLACTIEDVGDGTKRIVSGIKDGAGLYYGAVKANLSKAQAAIGTLASAGVYIGKELYDNVAGFFDDLFPGKETVNTVIGNDGTAAISAEDAAKIMQWYKNKNLYTPGETTSYHPTGSGNVYSIKTLLPGTHTIDVIHPREGSNEWYYESVKFTNNVSGKFAPVLEINRYGNGNYYRLMLVGLWLMEVVNKFAYHTKKVTVTSKDYTTAKSQADATPYTDIVDTGCITSDGYNAAHQCGTYGTGYYNIITAADYPSEVELINAMNTLGFSIYLDGVQVAPKLPTLNNTYNLTNLLYNTANADALEHGTTESEATGAHNSRIIHDIADSKFTAVIDNANSSTIGDLVDAMDAAGSKAIVGEHATTKAKVKYPAITDNDGKVIPGNPAIPISLPVNLDPDYPVSITPDGTKSLPIPLPDTIPWDVIGKAIPTVKDPTLPVPKSGGTTPAVVAPTVSGSALSMFVVHAPTDAEVASLSTYLWTPDFFTNISKIMQDPMSCIISLHQIYCAPSTNGTGNIKLGYLDSGVSAAIVSNQYVDIDCGYVTVPKYYGNAMDNDPYTSVQIYLPFIGFAQLSNAEVMGAKVYCKYVVDVFTGSCIAALKVVRDNLSATLYQYGGTCGVQLPITGSNFSGVISSLAGITAGAIGAIATGGVGGLAIGGMVSGAANAASKATSTSVSINRGGGFGSNIGAMGIKVPYIIITRKIAHGSTVQPYGLMDNTYRKLSECNGYVQIKEVNISGIKATKSELVEIESLLKEGVII